MRNQVSRHGLHVRKFRDVQVIAEFRPGVVVPLSVAAGVAVLFLIAIGIEQLGAIPFALGAWFLCALVILIRWRAAAIFTLDSFFVRPSLGRTLSIPLKGIKRAYIDPGSTDEDGPTLRIQLLVGGEITVGVPDMEAVVHLLNKGAGKGLDAPTTASADR